ncbi:MAG: dihydroxyacetone kinase [Lachnospiraceae bacterium]|nr:dihydroxyacetone kinase [Lachnospiraceae bacterium]
MKKLINDPRDVPMEVLEGFAAAYQSDYELVEGVKGIRKKNRGKGPAVVIGGGSGHEPMFAMFVGENLADAAACGNIFASPDPNTIVKTALSVENGNGILFLYGNYSGDRLNFDMASEILEDMGIQCRSIQVWDDVASAPKERIQDRRGIAGDVFVIKAAGAAAGAGKCLDEVYRIAQMARDNTFSVGTALSGGTIPGEKQAIFTLPDGEIEFGMGVHGEPGVKRMPVLTADATLDMMLDLLVKEAGLEAGDRVNCLINGLGSTTLAELYIMNRRLVKRMQELEIQVQDYDVNSYITCQEMAGVSLSVLKLNDELKDYMDMPCSSPHYTKERK